MSGVGEILKAIGDFGPFQKRLVLLTLIPCLSVAFHQFCQLFMVLDVPHHCDTSWIRTVGPNLTQEEQLNLTLPRDADGEYEQCSMYSPVDWDLDSIVAYGLNATQKCSSGWVYPAEPPSLLTEFDLVCDRKDLNDIGQAIYMAGLLLGSMIFGPLSDRIGRRPVILISVILQGLFGLGIAFVPHFYVYMAFRCVVGASVSGITMTILSLATEWIGVSSRPKAVLTSHCCFAIGQMILAGLSYGIRNWRLLEIAGSAPILVVFFYIGVLPESARWLVTKGRIEEAKKLLQKAAATNKRSLPEGLLEQLKPEKQTKSGSLLDLFRKKHLRKVTLIMSCAWFVNSFVYYGLSLNVTNFGLDIYLTQLAFGAVEIPARVGCIFTLQWFGRRKTQTVLLLLSGVVCLIITGIPEDQPLATTILATIGKFAASASFSTSYVYTAELFPTVVRQTGVGLCSMSARAAGILAPLVRLLGQYHEAIPMAIFGSAPVLGGLLCVLLPETRGMELQDDTEDGQTRAEVYENGTSSSENGQVKGKDGVQVNECTKTTYF
ncbi:PREDICTED: solute carrier family 22 member 13-like isoform X1 [Lepidothrix coronata]|uniref:Solute carrier family 22 member 13-like isoform X1 n=1 Tax=Lepidothrix coronata TaxID=321398 RepID=A0A6J0IDL5_9PASS|nr:PREDICTED: solute carrier family 22 member 13-like isoform X1 [Lepidothrix coronata]